ncbi:MAG: hypothetical protein JST58_04940 [Bacteroidetes bacterium]|nr:hypothetical protein [Bacteroidota bacterium]
MQKKKTVKKESTGTAAKRRQAPNGKRNKRRGCVRECVYAEPFGRSEGAARFAFLFVPFCCKQMAKVRDRFIR